MVAGLYGWLLLRGYLLLAWLGFGLMRLLVPFHKGIRTWVRGRAEAPVVKAPAGRRCIWMHCSSLGEFEQGRPVLEAVRQAYPDAWMLLTFFSPSGYDRQRHFPSVDAVTYLPRDTPGAVRRFLDRVQPDFVLWVKYDFWFECWRQLHRRGIPVYLIAARFRSEQWLFRNGAGPFLHMIRQAVAVAVQDEASRVLLEAHGFTEVAVAGDPRIDRVLAIRSGDSALARLEVFAGQSPVLVAGSVWDADVALLAALRERGGLRGWKWLLAPHDLAEARVQRFQQRMGAGVVRYSQWQEEGAEAPEVLILDNIGMLNQAYRLGAAAYVGGGFGRSVHNLLEPAVYGIPVLFGPAHHKFPEGEGLMAAGGGVEIRDIDSLQACVHNLEDADWRRKAGLAAGRWVAERAGATRAILAEMQRHLPSPAAE